MKTAQEWVRAAEANEFGTPAEMVDAIRQELIDELREQMAFAEVRWRRVLDELEKHD